MVDLNIIHDKAFPKIPNLFKLVNTPTGASTNPKKLNLKRTWILFWLKVCLILGGKWCSSYDNKFTLVGSKRMIGGLKIGFQYEQNYWIRLEIWTLTYGWSKEEKSYYYSKVTWMRCVISNQICFCYEMSNLYNILRDKFNVYNIFCCP